MNARTGIAIAIACVLVANRAGAQQTPTAHQAAEAAPEHEEAPRFEGEFVASTIFQNGLAAVRLGPAASPVMLDAHFYGVETNEIGITGLVWEVRHHGLRVLPGVGWAFGSENRPALAATVRWVFANERWFSEGLFVQSVRAHIPDTSAEEEAHPHESEAQGEGVRYAGVLEAHWSVRFGRVEIGPMVEHVRYREENEWKGGGRAAWRLGRGFKLVAQALAPDPELRGGLAWER